MKIVFATTCKNRAMHLTQTLPKNLAGNPRSRFVVLDYGSDERLVVPESERVALYRYETTEPFHMTHAKNMAHRLGMLEGADVLVNLDADNFLGDGFEDFVSDNFKSNTFLWSGFVKGLGRRMRGVSGRIAVTPTAFLKTGGYNEKYDTWSPDDKDFNARLSFLGYRPMEIYHRFLDCIPHGDGMRFSEYPHARDTIDQEEAALKAPHTAVANFGNFGCGEVTRGPCRRPGHQRTKHHGIWHGESCLGECDPPVIQLRPIPTRIFGIGLHKTATTSLHAALQILGYESAHWPSGAWARAVLEEMTAKGFSPTLEKTYAASDLPISILYKELDKAYPGSKFILTIRNESEWLRSVRDHFSYRNPYRWEWDKWPISNRIHRMVYGRKDFDYDTFRERYRRHNEGALDYFRDRPDDLLVMNSPDWPALCGFLGKPIPQVPYPFRFRTGERR